MAVGRERGDREKNWASPPELGRAPLMSMWLGCVQCLLRSLHSSWKGTAPGKAQLHRHSSHGHGTRHQMWGLDRRCRTPDRTAAGIMVTGWIRDTEVASRWLKQEPGQECSRAGQMMAGVGGEDGSGRTGHRKWSTGVQPARRRASRRE